MGQVMNGAKFNSKDVAAKEAIRTLVLWFQVLVSGVSQNNRLED